MPVKIGSYYSIHLSPYAFSTNGEHIIFSLSTKIFIS